MSTASTESHLAKFIRQNDTTAATTATTSPTTPPPALNQPCLQKGVHDLQKTIDLTMQSQWKTFQKQYNAHWAEFNTYYIQPSIAFIGNEKSRMDAEYQQLTTTHNKVAAKCADLERYNVLLQEKMTAVEQEMKSFSNVSMIAKWEKKLTDKMVDYEQLDERYQKEKGRVRTLQAENTMLNARIEQLEDGGSAIATLPLPTVAPTVALPTVALPTVALPTVARPTVARNDAPSPPPTTEPACTPAATDASPPPPTTEPACTPAATDASPPPPTTEPACTPATEAPSSTPATEAPSRPHTTEPTTEPSITYTVKQLKRPRVDTEKRTYLLGSNNVMYASLEDGTAGEAVGERKPNKNGTKMVIKFHTTGKAAPPTNT